MPTPTSISSCVIFSETLTALVLSALLSLTLEKTSHKHLKNCLLFLLQIPTVAHLRTVEHFTSPRLLLCQGYCISCCPVQSPCILVLLPPLPGVLSYLSHLLCRHSVAGNIFSGFDIIVPCRNNPASCPEIRMGSKALHKCLEAGPVCSCSSRGSRLVHLLRKPLKWLLPKEGKV